jgi:preprotein translocase subunit SecA
MVDDPIFNRFTKRQQQDKLEELAKKARRKDDVEAEEKLVKETEKVKPIEAKGQPGRNDPCPCGSGKKYKKCCGAPK